MKVRFHKSAVALACCTALLTSLSSAILTAPPAQAAAVTATTGPRPNWVLKNGVWVPVVPANPNTPQGQVASMIQLLKAGHPGKVEDRASKWLKKNRTNPLVPQVLLLKGDARVAQGNLYSALFPYEDLLDNFPNSPLYNVALKREYDIAEAFLHGYKRRFLHMRILPVTGDAIKLLDRVQNRQRGSPLAELAGIRIANYYYLDHDYGEALSRYQDFLRRYPYSQFAPLATVRLAETSLAMFKGARFDLTPLRDAEARLESLTETYPKLGKELQVKALEERIYQVEGKQELEIARTYWRLSKPKAAAFYYQRVINNWPDTQWANKARKELASRIPQEAGK